MDKILLYVKVEKSNLVNKKDIYIEDIAKLYSTNKEIVEKLNKHMILEIDQDNQKFYILSIFKVIEEINKVDSNIVVVNIGESDFIIQYDPPKKKIMILEYGKVLFVSLIVFFGAAFTIMTFNQDAGVKDLFKLVYELFLGDKKEGGILLEISYSIGLPLGIIIFFNHFSKAKIGKDPTPMQVQLRVYEENLDKTLIEDGSRRGKTVDSD